MQLLDYSGKTPEENLAVDEALLETAIEAENWTGLLRLWESPSTAVILGRASRVSEALAVSGDARPVPVLRRTSGGCAVVIGPGCLMYSLVLHLQHAPALASIDRAHAFVLGRIACALAPQAAGIVRAGTSDLALPTGGGLRKFSGNSLRMKRKALLYHGTILCAFPLDLIDRYLAMPPRAPEYRKHRAHADFITNLGLDPAAVRSALVRAFEATEPAAPPARDLVQRLIAEKYSLRRWNLGE